MESVSFIERVWRGYPLWRGCLLEAVLERVSSTPIIIKVVDLLATVYSSPRGWGKPPPTHPATCMLG